MNIPYVMKKCTCCGEWKVASTVNFHKQKCCRYGLHSKCKECRSKTDNPVNTDPNITQICITCGREFPATLEYFHKHKHGRHGLRDECKECANKKRKQYEQDNKKKIAERKKQYYQDNKEMIFEHNKQYYQSPQGQVVKFNERQRRRIKEELQGTGITKDQWLEMMKFFDFRCAYSGETLTDKTRSIDHIVPLNSNGDNMIWNCVPMLRSLNSSKSTKDMLEWYKEQDFYSEARLEKIYEWQEYAYNKWEKGIDYVDINDIQI